MTAREHIIEFLSNKPGYVQSAEIHDYVCRNYAIRRNGSHISLSRMVFRGEVDRRGHGPHARCRMAERNKPSITRLFDQLRGMRP